MFCLSLLGDLEQIRVLSVPSLMAEQGNNTLAVPPAAERVYENRVASVPVPGLGQTGTSLDRKDHLRFLHSILLFSQTFPSDSSGSCFWFFSLLFFFHSNQHCVDKAEANTDGQEGQTSQRRV